jgi:hypothetical protein
MAHWEGSCPAHSLALGSSSFTYSIRGLLFRAIIGRLPTAINDGSVVTRLDQLGLPLQPFLS